MNTNILIRSKNFQKVVEKAIGSAFFTPFGAQLIKELQEVSDKRKGDVDDKTIQEILTRLKKKFNVSEQDGESAMFILRLEEKSYP